MARRNTKKPLATTDETLSSAINGGIGKPLAVLTESNGSREFFEAVGTFMETHLQGSPFFTSTHDEITGQTETFEEIAASAIARSRSASARYPRICWEKQ